MPAKRKPASDPAAEAVQAATTAFEQVIEQALDQFHQPAWLGEHSPLAAPYFLGERLPKSAAIHGDTQLRGQAVQTLLLEAAAEFLTERYKRWNQGPVWYELLHASYFNPKRQPVHQLIHVLHTSEAAYHRNKGHAIENLAQEIIRRVKPALRLESITPPTTLIGRKAELTQLLTSLRAGKSVGINGPGGVGKTTLGQALAHHFAPAATFWYTITPGLNDRTHSLLFALAWFLHGQGVTTLWSQLLADQGAIKEEVALNLLRYDCARLSKDQILLVFDEVDLLRPNEQEAHGQLVAWLERLRGLLPVLSIGQKSLLETDQSLALTGLGLTEMAGLLQQAGLSLPDDDLVQLQRYTQGNPRLLELFVALVHSLQRAGEAAATASATALTSFAHEPSLEFLLRRIWRHLNEHEMVMLELLAVFRNAIPRIAWHDPAQQAALAQLVAWRLVHSDEQENLALLPAFKEAIYQTLLSGEEKELLHLEAATLRAQYGQFTAAAHHYAAGGESEIAVNLLYLYKEQAIDQGQAEAALTVLTQISQRRLSQEAQEKLTLLRADLQRLLGYYDDSLKTLQSIAWHIPFLAAQRWRLEGDIAELRGATSQAQNAYQTGLTTIEKLISEAAYFHRDLGYLYTNDVEFAQAETEVMRMRHEAANLEGFICEMRGNLPEAEAAYLTALQLAQTTQYAYGEANTQAKIGRIYAWRRQLAAAETQLQAAIEFFRNTGRLNKLASATYNLALARRLSKHYADAIAPAEEALGWFVQLGEEFGRAVANELLAEIHLGLGNLTQAEGYARHVIAAEHTSCLPDGLRTLGEIYLQQGDLIEAERLLCQSLELAKENEDRILEAYAWRALSSLERGRANPSAAQANWQQATQIFTQLGLTAEIEEQQ